MAEIISSARGKQGKILIFEGYRYHKNESTSNAIHWRCSRYRTCDSRLKSNLFDLNLDNPVIRIHEVSKKSYYRQMLISLNICVKLRKFI